jgi:hypothetical protein
MRHDIERVHAAIQEKREQIRNGGSETADHGDFVLVHVYIENWVPKLHGASVCLHLRVPRASGLCQVVALSSPTPVRHAIFREIVGGPRCDWPIDLSTWRSGLYDVLPVDHGPCLSNLIPLALTIDVLCSGPIEFTLVCDRIPLPEAKP